MALLASSLDSLQELLDQCELYAADYCMIYTIKKPVCMCIKPKRLCNLQVPPVTLNGRTIGFVIIQKYLGVLINDDLNDVDDINRQIHSICIVLVIS